MAMCSEQNTCPFSARVANLSSLSALVLVNVLCMLLV